MRGVVSVRPLSRAAAPAVALVAALLSAGCSYLPTMPNIGSWFGPDKPKPPAYEPITSPIAGRMVWNKKVEGVQFPLAVAVNGGVFTVAANDGTVLAVQAESGAEVWRANVGAKLSAGVGSDGRFAAVVTRDNELVTLENGQVKWRKPLASRVSTAPLVAGERVFVVGVDRAVQAFDALDGRKLWQLARPGDPLALTQNGVLQPFKDTLIVGQGPRLTGLDPLKGSVRWEVAVGSPRGGNEIERLADMVGPAPRIGDVICARSFQAAVGCVNAERGSLVWSKTIGGLDAIAADEQMVFAGDASDRLTAWKTANGDVVWNSDKLLYRGLSAPLSVGKTVVFGDSQGTVHWLSRETGATQLRMPTDGSAIVGEPVAVGTTMMVVTRNGGLFAFRPE